MKVRINEIEYYTIANPIKGEWEITIIGFVYKKVYGQTLGNAMDNVIFQLTAIGYSAKWLK
jgi:hypothetical protein